MRQVVTAPVCLQGTVTPPGDKSISHRAALFNAIAQGTARVVNYSPGGDCLSTLRCLRALGVEWERDGDGVLAIQGTGGALREPEDVLNAGNSGTTVRLLSGILAGQPFFSVVTGDRSLRSRPMGRVVQPLRLMGADVRARKGDTQLPLVIQGGSLRGIEYSLPVASAQLKSCLLLAGLFAQGETILHEPAASRDHTERMLQAMGARLTVDGRTVRLQPGQPTALDVRVPADISAAAFWLVAGVAHPNASVRVNGVGINPTRTGVLDALTAMGASVRVTNLREEGGEPVADLVAQSSVLRGTEISGDLVPRLLDEIPVLAVAACFAQGTTVIRDAAELRVKESDRLRTMAQELGRLGAEVQELPDGLVIQGTHRLQGARCRSYGDHRVAMSLAIAGLLGQGETLIEGAECASISYPGFWDQLRSLMAT
ncbi:MAG: 3-phosphoshikimate 1-carboxyvinyltransferase [Chloroflexi bacterium]|nr:3-phosphoshikimate 1-carboxyvinyltransferase [Chloroflexota bacterium]